MRIVKKLSNKEWSEMEIGKSVLLAGVVKTYEPGEGQHGPYAKFLGSFGAEIPTKDGNISVRAGVMFVPTVLESMIVGMVDEGLNVHGDAYNGTEFAFRLVKSPSPTAVLKYEWSVESVVEPTEATDPVSRILLAHTKPVEQVAASSVESEKKEENGDGSESAPKGKNGKK